MAYTLSCLVVNLWLTGMGMVFNSRLEATALIWARFYVFLGIIFITPSIYFFSVSWEEALFPERETKKKKLVAINFLCGLGFYLLCLTSDSFIKGLWQNPWGFYPKAGWAYIIFVAWFYWLMILMLLNFIEIYRKEKDAVKRQQAKLMIAAFSIAYLGSLEFLLNYGVSLFLMAFIPVFFCITIVGYSVVRYRMMDIETAIHKTIAWVVGNLILIAPFGIIFYFSRSWCHRLNNLGFFVYLSTLLLAFLVCFRFFQPKIDHFFQRRRYDLEEILSRFVDDIIHLKGINKLTERIENTIKETLYPQKTEISIYHQPGKKNEFLLWLFRNNKILYRDFIEFDPALAEIKEAARKHFDKTSAVVAIPLVLGGELLGLINLGKKANLKRYTAMDFHFLNILRNQSVIAISNSLVYENIEEQVRKRTEELIEVQNQLTQAAKLASVGTLAGGVAHEINNPLAAILTNVQMLLASLDEVEADELKDSLELIEEATKRCRNIVKKLMTYARKPMETQEVGIVNLLEVVEKVNSFLAYQFEQENIRMVIKAQDNQYPVVGNHNEFEQVVTNLVLNAKDAIKRVKKGGEIEILLTKNDGWVRLDIKDEGSGIPKENVPKIFDPFFTTKDVGKGLGLGLSISQSIVEKYKGSIFLKTQEGQGTTFTVNLPLAG